MRTLLILLLLSGCLATTTKSKHSMAERNLKLGCTYALYSHFVLSRLMEDEFEWVYSANPCEIVNLKRGTLNDPLMRLESYNR